MSYLVMFWAEIKREFILLFRYPFELVSRMVWNLGFAFLMFFGFGTIAGAGGNSLPGFQEGQMGRLLGLLITYIAINGLSNAAELLDAEVQTGTLEQAALSPPPLVVIVLMRDLASFIEMIIRFALVLALSTAVTGVRFHLDIPAFVLILTLMYLGTEGIGLMLGGAALLYKRIATLSQFAVMLVFGMAILPLDKVPGWMGVFVHHFPFSQALLVLRQVAIDGWPLSRVIQNGAIGSLVLNTAVFLGLGVVTFAWTERVARDWGTLNQY